MQTNEINYCYTNTNGDNQTLLKLYDVFRFKADMN